MADIMATGHLDESSMDGAWMEGGEYLIRWMRDGDTLAGLALCEKSVRELAALLNAAINEREEQ